jgi:prepilin-type N-terminal cleavage/methylation domain-containing protein
MERIVRTYLRKENGYTLIELVVTILLLGLICYFIAAMSVELLRGTNEQGLLVNVAALATAKMEEAARSGTNVNSQVWTQDNDLEWRRLVTTLKPGGCSPSLIEVKIEIRKNSNIVFSLENHIAG